MSQRLGMADGRCFTVNTSSRIVNDYIMKQNKISLENNYEYRKYLQRTGPDVLTPFQVKNESKPGNFVNNCMTCNKPVLKVPDIYK